MAGDCGLNALSLLPENCRLNVDRKLLTQKKKFSSISIICGRMDFPHEVRFSAAIGAAHFLADLRNAALSAFEERAPFMGTALAEYRQCIGAEVVCHFHLLFLFHLFIGKYLEMSQKTRIFAALKSNQPKSNF